MAEPLRTPEIVSTANGATATFATVWTFEYASEVRVLVDGRLCVQGVDYDLSGGSWLTAGANVVFRAGRLPTNGQRVVRRRVTLAQQTEPFGDQEAFRPIMAERAFDRLVRAVQDRLAETARTIRVPPGEPGSDLPIAALRRGRAIGFADTPEAPVTAIPLTSAAVASDLLRAEDARTRAETAKADALVAAQGAQTAEAVAVGARDAAQLSASQAAAFLSAFPANIIYDTEAAGRAAVADGVHFWERTANGLRSWRRVNAGASVAGPLVPSLVEVQALTVPSRYVVVRMIDGGPNIWVLEPTTRLPNNTGEGLIFRFPNPPAKSPGEVVARVLGINDADPWAVLGPTGDPENDRLLGTDIYNSQDHLEFERFSPTTSRWSIKRILNPTLAKVGSAAGGGSPYEQRRAFYTARNIQIAAAG